MTNEKAQHLGAIIVSVVTVLGFAVVCGLMFLAPRPDNQLMTVMFTTLAAGFVAVLNYWLGSSAGSKTKDQQITSLSQTISTLPPASTGNSPSA